MLTYFDLKASAFDVKCHREAKRNACVKFVSSMTVDCAWVWIRTRTTDPYQ